MILSQDIADRMRSALDAEGAEHYTDNQDIIPAINAGQEMLVSTINKTLSQRKLGEEIFRDLSIANVFQLTKDSRLSLDVFPEEVWTILAIYPSPITDTTSNPVVIPPDDKTSVYRSDLYHIKPTSRAAKRITIEEWQNNQDDPFEAGYEGDSICSELQQSAYLNPFNYDSNGQGTIVREIEINPYLNQGIVSVFYAKPPTEITSLTDSVEFPESVRNIITEMALRWISFKQGDGTSLYGVTQQDINTLLSTVL